jgi:hypothetical protein
MAADGSTKTVSRWRLFSVENELPPKMKAERTFGVNTGTISKILEYNARTKNTKWNSICLMEANMQILFQT